MPSPPPSPRLLAPLRGWGQVRDPPRPRCLPLPRPLLAALGPSPPHPRAPPAWAGSCPSRAAPGAGAGTGGEPSSPPVGSRGWPPSPLCSSCPRRHLLPASREGWGGPACSKGHFGGGFGGVWGLLASWPRTSQGGDTEALSPGMVTPSPVSSAARGCPGMCPPPAPALALFPSLGEPGVGIVGGGGEEETWRGPGRFFCAHR